MPRLLAAIWRWIDDNAVKVIITLVATTMLVVVLWPLSVIFIPAGHVGVLWSRFFGGTIIDHVFPEGTHIIFPWDVMTIYDGRLQLVEQNYDVLTADGLSSTVNIAFRFRIDERNVGILHKLVGPDYLNVLMIADVGAQARKIFARYQPEVAFTVKRSEIEGLIEDAVDKHLVENFNPTGMPSVRYVVLEDVLIRSVKWPTAVEQAIERKATELNRAQEYDFTLDAERKEAERKEIEAQGIRRFQDIIKDGLTDNYLRWRGIEATLSLAQSQNSKIVIIGSGPNGLPIILGNDTSPTPMGPMSTPNGPVIPPRSQSLAPSMSSPPARSTGPQRQGATKPSGPPTAGPPTPVIGSATPPGPGRTAPSPTPDIERRGSDSPVRPASPIQP